MTRLSVNINKIATLRNTREGNTPNVALAAVNCEKFGAEGITVHPRPDERHIRYSDVWELKDLIKTEFNIEGYPSKNFLDLVLSVKPDQVTLVPDPPEVLTSNSGWDTVKQMEFLTEVIGTLNKAGIRTSLFVGTEVKMIEKAAIIGSDRIELYTEPYAKNFPHDAEKAIKPFKLASEVASKNGLGLNAGHDLNLINLSYFRRSIPNLLEVSIGHALISDALYFGLEQTIKKYKECLI